MLDPSLISIFMSLSAASGETGEVAKQFEQWERGLRSKVERVHVVPAEAHRIAPCDVVIRFAVGRGGRPEGAEVRESSCGGDYEQRALAVVRAVGRIGAAPSASGKDHRVQLKLTYGAQADASMDRRLSAALDAERAANARRNLAVVATVLAVPGSAGWQSGER